MEFIIKELVEEVVSTTLIQYNIDSLSTHLPKEVQFTQANYQIPTARLGKPYYIESTLFTLNHCAPCIVYMHGDCCTRSEGVYMLASISVLNCHLFTYDYIGNGASQGEFMSSGYYDMDDVHLILTELSKHANISQFILWGRSLGAEICLHYMNKYHHSEVIGIICDSASVDDSLQLKESIDSYHLNLSDEEKSIALQSVAGVVLSKYGIKMDELCAIKGAEKLVAPILIIYRTEDGVIFPHHSVDLYNAYGGKDKKIISFKGKHNDLYPEYIKQDIKQFVDRLANIKE